GAGRRDHGRERPRAASDRPHLAQRGPGGGAGGPPGGEPLLQHHLSAARAPLAERIPAGRAGARPHRRRGAGAGGSPDRDRGGDRHAGGPRAARPPPRGRDPRGGGVNGTGVPTATDVLAAAARLRGRIRATPLEPSPALSEAAGREVLLKLEGQQRPGPFKVRGALNAVLSLTPEERARGVVTASAGNHGLGVALAAGEEGVRATVFVPATAPATKRERIARYGADLRLVDGGYDAAHHAAG